MDRKFEHEHHNRQDKAKKPDYQQELRESGPSPAGGFNMASALDRADARKRYMEALRKHRFVLNGVSFKFGWSIDVFARKNNLPENEHQTAALLEKIRQAAERDVAAFASLVKSAPIRKCSLFYKFYFTPPSTECEIFRK